MTVDRQLLEQCLPGYEVAEEIGRGGWGVVLRGRHRKLGREVAIKQLPAGVGDDPAARERFLAEARIVASLDHPHLVPLFDYVEHEGTCVIVMELLSGGTLWDRFRDDGLAPDEAIAAVLAALVALDHAHERGVLHRDLKPENLLFSSSGVLKIADFGIAKDLAAASSKSTLAGAVVGTPAYMAPEQADGSPVTPATDVYSAAAMLYELLSGALPFPGDQDVITQLVRKTTTDPVPLVVAAPAFEGPVADVVMRALARDPAARIPTAMDFARELAVAATALFGPGWLRQCSVSVLGAGQIVSSTEQVPPAPSPAPTQAPTVVIRPDEIHSRVGAVQPDASPGAAVAPGASLPPGVVPAPEAGPIGTAAVEGAPSPPAAPPAAPASALLPPAATAMPSSASPVPDRSPGAPGVATPPPAAPAPIAPVPSAGPPSSSTASPVVGPSPGPPGPGSTSVGTPAPAASSAERAGSTIGRNRLLALVAVTLVLIGAGVALAIGLGGGDGEERTDTAGAEAATSAPTVPADTATASSSDPAVSAAMQDRFRQQCVDEGVASGLCGCAFERAAQLPTAVFEAGLELMTREVEPGLSPAFEEVFDACVADGF
jgi:serine/threonine protein kinase